MNRLNRSKRWNAGPLAAGLLCAVLAAGAHAADIYKWVDETGVTHYSNIKPSGVKWQLVSEGKLSVIPGNRIGAEADRAAERDRAAAARADDAALQQQINAQARAQRREQRVQECLRNNGVDCAREVDTELRAEGIQEGRGVIRTVPPAVNVAPAPATSSSAPSAPASSIR
jgi:hypothetical protein